MDNLSTIVIALILALILGTIIFFMIRNRKKGKSSCSCGCAGCRQQCNSKK